MKSTIRRAAVAAGIFALPLAGAPLFGQQQPQQRGGPPGQDTPYILVTTFHSPDRQLGVQVGDELRRRLQQEHSAKELFVITKQNISNTLEASGYRADSALSASDLMELAKTLRGDQVIDGMVTKNAAGQLHVDARLLMKSGQAIVAQPLPKFDAKDAGDAAKHLEQEISDAGKSLPSYRTCTSNLRAAKYAEALTEARKGLALYPTSTLDRLCILQVFAQQKAPADSIIAVASAIRNADSTSMPALAYLADAYAAKADTANAIRTNLAIARLDPSNTSVVQSIIAQLANFGSPKEALTILDTVIQQNPGDPNMLKTRWLLLLRAREYKQALAAGEEYVKADTAAASLDYFERQIGAAQSDSNAAAVQQFAARAAQKFPKEISFPLLLASAANKAGQLQQSLEWARKAIAIDPKNTNAWLLAIAAANGMNMRDSSAAFAHQAIAAGADKATFGTALLGPTQELFTKAQASKARADWEAVLKSAQSADALVPSPQAKFFVGVSSFSVAADMINDLQTEAKAAQKTNKKAEKEAACTTAKSIDDLLATTLIAMPAGATVSKETAGQIMSGVTQLSDYVSQVKKAFSCK